MARPHIIASITVYGIPSEILDKATTCPASKAIRDDGTGPSSTIPSVTPSRSASARHRRSYSSLPSGVGPNNRNLADGNFSRTSANAATSVSRSFSGSTRPTQLIVGTSGSPMISVYRSGSTPL